jgi:muramoyltetrapeptide carboxypeptidase LdcA involved in peptidoglycan recycling
MKGNLVTEKSFPLYEKDKSKRTNSYNLTEKVYWENLNGDVDIKGRIIGGCLDCLKYLPGTKFDNTINFIEKYKDDGIIWYFDIFSLTVEDLYCTLFQLKECNWFKYLKGIIVGRVMFPNSFGEKTYQSVLKEHFPDIPIIFNADIGHVSPKMTIINGSLVHITSASGTGKIEFGGF